jgi:hypothetical protein
MKFLFVVRQGELLSAELKNLLDEEVGVFVKSCSR